MPLPAKIRQFIIDLGVMYLIRGTSFDTVALIMALVRYYKVDWSDMNDKSPLVHYNFHVVTTSYAKGSDIRRSKRRCVGGSLFVR